MPRRKKNKAVSVAAEVIADDAANGRKYEPTWTGAVAEPVEEPEPDPEPAEEVEAPKPKKPTKQKADLSKLTTDGDLVDIWERRLLNPLASTTRPIRITTPGMEIRWINLKNPGRFQRARYEQGWVPVCQAELVDEREIYGATYTTEGFVCRGEKQTEMLMKMPTAVYRRIQQKLAELNKRSYEKLRSSMGSAGHQHFKDKYGGSAGDQAAEAASQFVGSVKFGTEKVSSDGLFEE